MTYQTVADASLSIRDRPKSVSKIALNSGQVPVGARVRVRVVSVSCARRVCHGGMCACVVHGNRHEAPISRRRTF